MRFRWNLILLVVGLLVSGIALYLPYRNTHAQGSPEDCQALVAQTTRQLNTTCAQLGRNQACVAGGPVLVVDAGGEIEALPGEQIDLNPLHSISAGGLNVEAGEWGVLALSEGAGLPANTPEDVRMWLFGGAELIDQRSEEQRNAHPTATCYATVITENLNVRAFPATNSRILGLLRAGDTVIITGRLADATWWRIDYGDQPAWVFSGFVRTVCQIIEIPVVLRDAPALPETAWYRDPFQIAALRSEIPTQTCSTAPPPGLLLQPPSTGRSRLTLNSVIFDLQASLFVRANAQDGLLFQAIEGPITLSLPDGWSMEVPPGAQVRFPLSEDGLTATAPARGLEPLDVEELATLPLNRLPHPLEKLPRPLIEIPLEEHVFSDELIPGDDLTFFFDNRGGIVHQFQLSSNAFPVLSVFDPDLPVLRPYIALGQLNMPYWTISDQPHLFQLAAGTSRSGTYRLSTSTQDLRLCRPEGNSQSASLSGGEDHAGHFWFGHAGEVVTLTATGDISRSASSYPGWRLRIFDTFLETPTLPPIQYDLLEGYNADSVTWTVPRTGYYWIEVWTASRGTTTVTSACADQ